MCRWGCTTTNTTYMCKWCGTRYCKECLHGDFVGQMKEPTKCRICNQIRCQGARVEYVPSQNKTEDGDNKRGKSAPAGRGRSPAKSARPTKSAKGSKSAKGKKSGKKSGKKKKKK
ncbi:uncharacterized protein [Argopecten irradians]|uniref:uncharacterized protein n=1 Tax=Argopecten irradians TaxID=31199 RepID=UPI00371F7048